MGRELKNIDLTAEQRKEVTDLLKRYLPDSEVWAYGSRVKFTSKPSSDLDMVAFVSKEQSMAVADLKEAFEESNLPFRVDLFIWDEVPEQFHKNIEAERVVLQRGKEEQVMARGWKEVLLKDVCSKIGSGATPRGGNSVYLSEGEFSLIRSQNVRNHSFDHNGLAFIEKHHADKLSNVSVEEEDVLLNITGDSVARCCQVDPSVLPARVNQHVAIIRPVSIILDAQYLRYYFVSPAMQNEMLSMAGIGATRNALTKGMIENFEIPLPPLPEQKAIAHILGVLDDKIELNRRMNATLEGMAQSLFKSWFVDFDPVIDNALVAENPIPEEFAARAETRQEALADGTANREAAKTFPNSFQETEEMGWIPEGWEVSTIGGEVIAVGGGTPSTKNELFWNGVHPFCTPKDMSKLDSLVLSDTERHLTDLGAQKVSSGILPKGTLLMSSRAPIGYLAIAETPVTVNQGVIALLKNETYQPMFLLSWLRSNMEKIVERANGSTFLEISKKNFKPIPFLKTSKETLLLFNAQVEVIHRRIVISVNNTNQLTNLRDTLLPKLISGELRIEDAEKMVEDIA